MPSVRLFVSDDVKPLGKQRRSCRGRAKRHIVSIVLVRVQKAALLLPPPCGSLFATFRTVGERSCRNEIGRLITKEQDSIREKGRKMKMRDYPLQQQQNNTEGEGGCGGGGVAKIRLTNPKNDKKSQFSSASSSLLSSSVLSE